MYFDFKVESIFINRKKDVYEKNFKKIIIYMIEKFGETKIRIEKIKEKTNSLKSILIHLDDLNPINKIIQNLDHSVDIIGKQRIYVKPHLCYFYFMLMKEFQILKTILKEDQANNPIYQLIENSEIKLKIVDKKCNLRSETKVRT